MAFEVEVTYPTRLGGLNANMSTSQTVATRDEATALRNVLSAAPELASASIKIKNAKPLPTFDEAMDAFRRAFREHPVRAVSN